MRRLASCRSAVLLVFLFTVLVGGLSGQIPSKPIPVLLVTGANNHDWRYTSKHIAGFLNETGRFQVTITEEPAKYLAEEDLTRFKAVFLDYNGPRWGEAADKKFIAAVKNGLGVSIMHAANNAFPGWKEYETLCCLCWRKGTGHGKFHKFDVDVIDRNHPITRDLQSMEEHPDELYHKLVHMHKSKFDLLATAKSSKESGGTGKDEPMALTTMVGKGRVFHTPLGHVWPNQPQTRVALDDPQLKLLLARGTEWAATGDCTIKPGSFGLKSYVGTLSKRPADTWVRRCVLDGKARMIVIQLDEAISIAWDAQTCSIYRVWGGILKLQGTVFDGVHGPQPATVGIPYAARDAGSAETSDGPRKYLGYRINDGRITLRYRAGKTLNMVVEETLVHKEGGKPSFARAIKVFSIEPTKERIRLSFCPSTSVEWFQVSSKPEDGKPVGRGKEPGSDRPLYIELGNGFHIITTWYEMGAGEKK